MMTLVWVWGKVDSLKSYLPSTVINHSVPNDVLSRPKEALLWKASRMRQLSITHILHPGKNLPIPIIGWALWCPCQSSRSTSATYERMMMIHQRRVSPWQMRKVETIKGRIHFSGWFSLNSQSPNSMTCPATPLPPLNHRNAHHGLFIDFLLLIERKSIQMRELMDMADLLLLLCVLCVSWTHGGRVVVAVLNRQRDEPTSSKCIARISRHYRDNGNWTGTLIGRIWTWQMWLWVAGEGREVFPTVYTRAIKIY